MIELNLGTVKKTSEIEVGDILSSENFAFLVIHTYENGYVDEKFCVSVLDLKTYSLNALTEEDAQTYKIIKKATLSIS